MAHSDEDAQSQGRFEGNATEVNHSGSIVWLGSCMDLTGDGH